MQVVFEELEHGPDPDPRPRPLPRWLPMGILGAVALVVAVVVSHGDGRRTVAASPSASPSASPVTSFLPVGNAVPVVVLETYVLPGVMSVVGRRGWQLDAAASTPDLRRYTASDNGTGSLRTALTFGVADRAPAATIDAEAARRVQVLAAAGASGFSEVLSAYEDTMAADLSYTAASGRYVMERTWLHGRVALFVQISDVAAESVSTVFDDTVRYGVIAP